MDFSYLNSCLELKKKHHVEKFKKDLMAKLLKLVNLFEFYTNDF